MLNTQFKNSCFHNFIVTVLLSVFVFFQAIATVDAGDREDPLVAFKFGLEVEGKLAAYFTNVKGIGSASEVIEEKITNPDTGETITRKNPGKLKWLNITLQRGLTSDMSIWDWRQQVAMGDVDGARTDCSIMAFNQANEEIARWNLSDAWPRKVVGPQLTIDGATYMVEELILVHEGVERVE